MKLFTVGPTEMFQTTKEVRKNAIPYFRTAKFSEDMFEADTLLKETMGTTSSSKVVYLTASGTAAMEATILNCFDENDKLLVVSGGSFGQRFEEICKLHCIPYDAIRLDHFETLSAQHLQKYERKKYTALVVNLHETSTGQLYNIEMIKAFCEKENMLLVVDAIATFLCDDYKMDDWGVDATIISSQKGLCVSPGMSMVVLNERMVSRTMQYSPKSLYFNFKDYISNMERGQTPYTPAISIVYEMLDMLKLIKRKGLQTHLRQIENLATVYRKEIVEDGIFLPPHKVSNAITVTCFPLPVAERIYKELVLRYDMWVNPTGGDFGQYSFRVAHIGDLTEEDTVMVAKRIKALYSEMK